MLSPMKVIFKKAPKASRGRNLTLVWGVHDFPTGKILVALSHEGLCWAGLDCGIKALEKCWPGANLIEDCEITAPVAREVARLWPQKLEALSVPVVLYGTEFQLKVWREILRINPGATATYAAIARKIGNPQATRAVGTATGANPVSVVVPCHRVVNTSGGKVSYGWGPALKKALLQTEGVKVL